MTFPGLWVTFIKIEEQASLRKKYVENARANLWGQLESITMEHPDGSGGVYRTESRCHRAYREYGYDKNRQQGKW